MFACDVFVKVSFLLTEVVTVWTTIRLVVLKKNHKKNNESQMDIYRHTYTNISK